MKPIIGITANVSIPNDPNRTFSKGVALHLIQHHYIQFVETGGGVPVILPVVDDPDSIAAMVERVDGIVSTGGIDLDPLLYDQTNSENHSQGINPRCDHFEIALIQEARRQDRAIIGICRGEQILNVALGGDLYQDIPSQFKGSNPHMFLPDSRERYHLLKLVGNSILTELFENNERIVNSSHHQAVKKLGKGLSIIAISEEGIIEAIQAKDDRCTIGVQWHPERMLGNYPTGWPLEKRPPQIRLAEWFVSQAKR